MSNGDTEEKTLAPTEHKLRKAREKGQVANSEDFITSIVTAVTILYLILTWPSFFSVFGRTLDISVATFNSHSHNTLLLSFIALVYELMYLVGPLAIIIIIASVAANVLQKQGIPFSLHPIKPDFNKINPGEGLKKLFSRRNASEFGVSLVKITVWFALSGVFIVLSLQTILASTYCSIGCVTDSAVALGALIILAAIALLFLSGLLDLPLQTMLFNHEQKMGHKELKRELKDTLGAPEFKQHRREEHQSISNIGGGSEEDGNRASGRIVDGQDGMTIIISGSGTAVGIYYQPDHYDVPKLVKRFNATTIVEDMTKARKQGIPIFSDNALASELAKTVEVGGFVKERHFEKVALLLVEAGAI